mmetsp:Transcript_6347/g.14740  ORF Transcript_6347/g.14740 Transcript_6347/m.14740 type:complete len:99 (-) Transcript_6347:230-526(-)
MANRLRTREPYDVCPLSCRVPVPHVHLQYTLARSSLVVHPSNTTPRTRHTSGAGTCCPAATHSAHSSPTRAPLVTCAQDLDTSCRTTARSTTVAEPEG